MSGGVVIILIVVVVLIVAFAAFLFGPFGLALWERRNRQRGDRGMGADRDTDDDETPPPGDAVPNREQTDREKGEIFGPR